jgi:hypothetical protein
MDNKLPTYSEEELQGYLDSMTPLELASHNARMSAWMLANFVFLQETVETIEEVDILRDSENVEERSLLPVAELGLSEMIVALPSYGDA